jgi:cytochrome P450
MNRTITPGEYLPITNFPFLKFIPDRFVPSKGFAKQTYRETTDIFAHARTLVEVRRKSGRIRDSLLDRLLDGAIRSDVPLTYAQVNSGVLGATYQGGSETSTAHTLTNLLFLAKYPHYQDKARMELDRVCGAERMPRWSDFNKLPYINCIVKEGLRIRPV